MNVVMELLSYTFFQYAIIGCLLASVVCGLVGTYVVTKRMLFISGGITHSSLGGVGLGLYLGLPPILGASVFAILSALGIEWLAGRRDVREDSAIAMVWTFGMSVGVMFSYLTPGYVPDLTVYLFGNILTIQEGDLAFLAVLAVAVVAAYAMFRRLIVLVAFDEEYAASLKLPVTVFNYLAVVAVSLAVVSCIRIAGIVLTLSMLTVPTMTASLFTRDYTRIIILSIAVGFAACIGGLALSYWWNIPSGTSIVFVSIIIYLVSRLALRGCGRRQ